MLLDFRFVLGAILAITLLGVAGLGLVTSVQLVREAHLGPLPASRSLAFAGHTEWNQFYDPDSARRFEGLVGKPEAPVAQARLETPDEIAPTVAPVEREERTASLPPSRIELDIALDKTTETDPPHKAEVPAPVTIAAPTAEPAREAAPDAPGATEPDPPPAERVASAPATAPAADLVPEPQAPTLGEAPKLTPPQPQAGAPVRVSTPPHPPARPKAHFRKKIARPHIRRRINVAGQQTLPNAGLPTANAPWPGYDNQFTDAVATKKNAGKLSGTLTNRPQ